jgi:hypothetical protein
MHVFWCGESRKVPVPKWLVVARNEYRIRTSRIRKIRPFFPYLVIGLLAVYVAFIAPAFVSLFIDDFLTLLLSQAAVATVQIILFMIFIYFIMLPITDTLREEQTGQLEIFLAAPIKPSDVLLGEFLGEMPYYAIFITVITGFFTAILNTLGLDMVQTAIIVIIFVVTFLSAIWIGTVIAAILRTKLGKTARGRDIGRALAMIIALPMVALVYAMMYGGLLEAETSGIVKIILGLLPSSWGAEIIVGFASKPGNIGAVGFETLTRFGSLTVFFVVVLWLGAKMANRAYSLEPTTFIASKAKLDGVFYKTVKQVGGGGSFGTLLVSIFKDYSRRLENLSGITYIIGIIVLMNIFIMPNVPIEPDGSPVELIMNQFMLPILAVMVAGGVTVQGKESIFIFKKSPSGVARLVKTRLVQSWLVVVPIAGVITAVTTILSPQNSLISLLINSGLMMLFVTANVAFALGLFLLNPVFSVKSVKLWINLMIVQFVSIVLFVISMFVLTGGGPEPIGGILYVQLLLTVLSWLVGIVFLYLGKRKLSRIE